MAGLMQAYVRDRDFRIAHHGDAVPPPSGFGGVADTITPGAALGEWIGAKLTVLTNIVPAAPNRLAERLFLGDAKVDIGEEGMVISFP